MVGKTTLLDSIAWTLYGYLPKWGGPKGGPADAVIKRGQDKCAATVIVEHSGDVYEITRQRPVKLIVKKNGEVQEGKTADLDKRIPQMIGMTDSQFLLCVYMPQKRSASFFNMSDSDRTELLSKVAGLEELDSALLKVKAKRSQLSHDVEFLNGRISAMEHMLAKFPEEKQELKKNLNQSLDEWNTASIALSEIEEPANIEIVSLETSLAISIDEINSNAKAAIVEHEEKLKTLKAESERVSKEISESPKVPQELIDAVDKARARLDQEKLSHQKRDRVMLNNERIRNQIKEQMDLMDSASKGTCNHCNQELPQATKEQQAIKHLNKAKELELQLEKLPGIFDLSVFEEPLERAITALNLKKNELSERPRVLNAEWHSILEQMKSEQTMIDMKRTAAQRDISTVEAQTGSKILNLRQQIKDAKSKVETAKRVASQYGEAVKKLEEKEEKEFEELNTTKIKLASLQGEMDEYLDLMDLFGPKGFRTLCFEDLIARISDRAGQLLSIMTEGLYSTRIEQAGENGKGEHRVILRPVLTRGGLEVPQDDLSGGAEATVTLNYDVAISEAIAENSPLFLDEALDGLDALGKAEAIRLLEEVARTRPVFLIDHTDAIKSSVQNVIQITYKNDTSTLENGNEDSDSASITG